MAIIDVNLLLEAKLDEFFAQIGEGRALLDHILHHFAANHIVKGRFYIW
jgi:hypothetical protein